MHNRYMTSKTTRLATASLLAITLPLASGSIAFADTAARQHTLVQVRTQTDLVSRDITLAVTHTSVLPEALRAQTSDGARREHLADAEAAQCPHVRSVGHLVGREVVVRAVARQEGD